MHESLITDGKFNLSSLFTAEVMNIVERINQVAKEIPPIIMLDGEGAVPTTPAIATGAIGMLFGLQVKRNISTITQHSLHERKEDILVLNDNVLIVVWRQFERIPRPVYVGDPSNNPYWKDFAPCEVAPNEYDPVEFSAILELVRILRIHEKGSVRSYPHCS